MMRQSILQTQRITLWLNDAESRIAPTGLLICHPNSAVKDGIGIAIAGIKKVENFASKIEPVVFIKILRMVLSDGILEVALPFGNGVMIGFGSGSKIVGRIVALLMKIDVNMRHPLLELLYTLAALFLREPRPVAVQIKIIVIRSSSGPRFVMFASFAVGIKLITHRLFIPVHIAVAPVGIEHRIHNYDRILQPGFGAIVAGAYELVNCFHGSLAAGGLVAVHIVT